MYWYFQKISLNSVQFYNQYVLLVLYRNSEPDVKEARMARKIFTGRNQFLSQLALHMGIMTISNFAYGQGPFSYSCFCIFHLWVTSK